jgi:hypothetical protein
MSEQFTTQERDFFSCVLACLPPAPKGTDIGQHVAEHLQSAMETARARQSRLVDLITGNTPEALALKDALTLKVYHGARQRAAIEREQQAEQQAARLWAARLDN